MADSLPNVCTQAASVVPRPPASFWQALVALLRLRCPQCRTGRMFHGLFGMNDPCPCCGLIFQREEGYFLGAMYVSYFIGVFVLGGGYYLGMTYLGWNDLVLLSVLLLLYLPLTPLVFRYARALWIYLDRWVFPGDVSAGSYEKVKAREIARRAAEGRRGGR